MKYGRSGWHPKEQWWDEDKPSFYNLKPAVWQCESCGFVSADEQPYDSCPVCSRPTRPESGDE